MVGAVGVDLGALGALAHPATHIPAKAADSNRREPTMAEPRLSVIALCE
jgi:hypothetical protein